MHISKIQKLIIDLYRGVSIIVLSGLIGGILWVALLLAFYMINSTWAAPTILSTTSDKMLQFTSGYQQAEQNIETLRVTESQAERDVIFAHNNVVLLSGLKGEMVTYSRRTGKISLNKINDLFNSYNLLGKLNEIKDQTQKSLDVGLITNSDATQTITAIQQFANGTTDSNLALGTTEITVAAQTVQLIQQLAQAENDVKTKEDTLVAAKNSLKLAESSIEILRQSAYYTAMNRGSDLAFVPYDTLKNTKVGMPIYDCYLHNFLCRRVGKVVKINGDEYIIPHPFFKIDTRGVLIELQLSDRSSMYSKVIFIGSRPLFL